MAIQILMPALSPTMEEGKLAKWLVAEGDRVRSGDLIAEIETDKATMEVEAVDEGRMGRILVPAGTERVKVNTPIAVLLEEGEAPAAQAGSSGARSPRPAPSGLSGNGERTAGSGAQPAPRAPHAAPSDGALSASAHGRRGDRQSPTHAPAGSGPTGRVLASPLARRLAQQFGLDLAAIAGSGPRGRIVRRDIETAQAAGAAHAVASEITARGSAIATLPGPAQIVAGMADDKILQLYEQGSFELVPHDSMRKVIAERLVQSKQTIPHFYLSIDCRLDELLRARARMNEAAPKSGPRAYKLSVNDFLIKAMALALQQVPAANATWTSGGMLRHRYSDIGVAVAVDGGLFTPVVRHAEMKTLSEISNEMHDLAERARKRRLAPHEYQGGTTSISNLGMYGIRRFDAVINPPHATILAVGAGERRPLVAGDAIEIATVMSCTLSCDHRVVDGALGAELLAAFRAFVEDPVRMLV